MGNLRAPFSKTPNPTIDLDLDPKLEPEEALRKVSEVILSELQDLVEGQGNQRKQTEMIKKLENMLALNAEKLKSSETACEGL